MVMGVRWARPLLELCLSSEPEQALLVPAPLQGAGKGGGPWPTAPRLSWGCLCPAPVLLLPADASWLRSHFVCVCCPL